MLRNRMSLTAASVAALLLNGLVGQTVAVASPHSGFASSAHEHEHASERAQSVTPDALSAAGASTGAAESDAWTSIAGPERVVWVTDDDTVMMRDLTMSAGEGPGTGDEDTALYTAPGSIQQTDLSRDGHFVAWTYYALEPVKSNRIMVITADPPGAGTSPPVNVLRNYPRRFTFIGAAAWSPDASKLAFIGKVRRTGNTGVYSVDRNGRHLRTLVRSTNRSFDNSDRMLWSPSGSKVAWLSISPDPYKFADSWKAYDLNRHRVSRLPNGFFGWSPDERWTGVARGNLQWSLFRRSVRTGKLKPIVRAIEDQVLTDDGPYWMPDGQVVYEDEEEWLALSGTRPRDPRRVAVADDFYCCVSWQ
jgi:hypothetical protein